MAIDHKAFFAESKRLQDEFGMTRDQAEMLAAHKFWEGAAEKAKAAADKVLQDAKVNPDQLRVPYIQPPQELASPPDAGAVGNLKDPS